jgi:hypothetical protein
VPFILRFLGQPSKPPPGRPEPSSRPHLKANAFSSQAKFDFLIGFPRFVRADPDRHFPVKASQEFE